MNRLTKAIALAAVAGATTFSFVGCAGDSHEGHNHGTAAGGKPYPLSKCLVTDEDFHGKPYTFVHEGQEIKLCCEDCMPDFQKDPAKYMSKLTPAK